MTDNNDAKAALLSSVFEETHGGPPLDETEFFIWLVSQEGKRSVTLLDLFEEVRGRLPSTKQEFSDWLAEGKGATG